MSKWFFVVAVAMGVAANGTLAPASALLSREEAAAIRGGDCSVWCDPEYTCGYGAGCDTCGIDFGCDVTCPGYVKAEVFNLPSCEYGGPGTACIRNWKNRRGCGAVWSCKCVLNSQQYYACKLDENLGHPGGAAWIFYPCQP